MSATTRDTHATACRRSGKASARLIGVVLLLAAAMLSVGCDEPKHLNSTAVDRDEFNRAGPIRPQVDLSQAAPKQVSPSEYPLHPGDHLLLKMPMATQSSAYEHPDMVIDVQARVDAEGQILLPLIGQVPVAGLTTDQAEIRIRDTYYPKYLVRPPTIVVHVAHYRTNRVNVVGAVFRPGKYELRQNEMTLISALLAAGGIDEDGSASIIVRKSHQSPEEGKRILLPIKGMDVPFQDIELEENDIVEVERLKHNVFSVVGLVKNPYTHHYPVNARYTLMQGIAMSGGTNPVADPQYATVYRQTSDGRCVHARFSLKDLASSPEGQVMLKPGDVVAVEQTTRTQLRVLLTELLRVGAGVDVRAGYSLGG
ncbi:MAG: polysaccharide biosynthesis/export family protein [Phycisphaerae bacterium]